MKPSASLISAESASACAFASLSSSFAGTSGCTALTSSSEEVPSLAAIEMPSNSPSLCSSVWAVPMSNTARVAPPSESTSPNVAMPVSS